MDLKFLLITMNLLFRKLIMNNAPAKWILIQSTLKIFKHMTLQLNLNKMKNLSLGKQMKKYISTALNLAEMYIRISNALINTYFM